MPHIHLEQPHNLGRKVAREKVEAIVHNMKQRLGLACTWSDDALEFSRTGTSGTITVGEKSVIVEAHLGLMFTPFKAEIERQMQNYLENGLAQ